METVSYADAVRYCLERADGSSETRSARGKRLERQGSKLIVRTRRIGPILAEHVADGREIVRIVVIESSGYESAITAD